MRIQQALYARLPDWARPDHIIQRYARGRRTSWYGQLMLILAMVAVALSLLIIRLIVYVGDPHQWTPDNMFYFLLLVVQLLTLALALLSAPYSATKQQGGTWETLRITSHGAELVMRARWTAALYRLRGPLLLLIISRLVLAGRMLVDVTGYGGHHLDLYLYGITPGVSPGGAVIALAALMTAALLALPVLFGLNAALGLLISTAFYHRITVFVARLIVLMVEITLVGLALHAGGQVLDRNPFPPATVPASTETAWFKLLLMGAVGDQGLRFMDLDTFLQTWADVDYGVLLGGALLLVVVTQVGLLKGLLALVTRRASRPQKG